MANTEKQNFRYDQDRWKLAVSKTEQMRIDGWDIDMTVVLTAAVDQLLDETPDSTAERLGLVQHAQPVRRWHRRYARGKAGNSL